MLVFGQYVELCQRDADVIHIFAVNGIFELLDPVNVFLPPLVAPLVEYLSFGVGVSGSLKTMFNASASFSWVWG